ncbi:hypothetical protein ENUP19_0160G0030 [Entamoeba nuttalli]
MIIELFNNHQFVQYIEMNVPIKLEMIYSEIEEQKKLALHQITLIYNGYVLPKKGKCEEWNINDKSTIRMILPLVCTIKKLSQTEGPCCGGTRISINGRFPYSGRKYQVEFGTITTLATFKSHTEIIVITPAHEQGVVNVRVCYEGGEESNPLLFTFVRFEGFNRKYARCATTPTFTLGDNVQYSIQ